MACSPRHRLNCNWSNPAWRNSAAEVIRIIQCEGAGVRGVRCRKIQVIAQDAHHAGYPGTVLRWRPDREIRLSAGLQHCSQVAEGSSRIGKEHGIRKP